ncbi:MAG TPA: phosphatidate cytidylyltransferase [Rubrobacteraceae bacterium]|nr:phosphatidate cytidylyltransferase [Rubrobacteraceae bacterium]
MLRWRTVTALILAPIVLGAIMLGPWAVLTVVFIVVVLAARELALALNPLPFPAAVGAGILPVLLSIPYGQGGILAGAVLSLPWALLWLAGRPEARTLRAILALLLMALWVGTPMAHLGLIAELPDGLFLILVAVVGPWISDSGAYFAGRFFGHHPLFPSLSPKKTVEGAIGGLLLTVLVVGWGMHYFLGFGMFKAALVGAAISLFSQSGDLFESILKRILDLKDLGDSLPGHGGILDRIDSLLFTAPAIYYVSLFL